MNQHTQYEAKQASQRRNHAVVFYSYTVQIHTNKLHCLGMSTVVAQLQKEQDANYYKSYNKGGAAIRRGTGRLAESSVSLTNIGQKLTKSLVKLKI